MYLIKQTLNFEVESTALQSIEGDACEILSWVGTAGHLKYMVGVPTVLPDGSGIL
jgi:hypothetical protein